MNYDRSFHLCLLSPAGIPSGSVNYKVTGSPEGRAGVSGGALSALIQTHPGAQNATISKSVSKGSIAPLWGVLRWRPQSKHATLPCVYVACYSTVNSNATRGQRRGYFCEAVWCNGYLLCLGWNPASAVSQRGAYLCLRFPLCKRIWIRRALSFGIRIGMQCYEASDVFSPGLGCSKTLRNLSYYHYSPLNWN